MKTTNYKKGDVVLLCDGRYEYLGELLVDDVLSHSYKPVERVSKYALVKNEYGEFAPFFTKMPAEVVGAVARISPREEKTDVVSKVLQWWKASNRWKHFLFAIPLGAVCGAHFVTGVGLGMEVKDHLYGNKADFIDFALTTVGGLIGHGAMRLIGLDYGVMAIINLIF